MTVTPLLPTDCWHYELYDTDTEMLRPPHAPAVAKPFHLVAEYAFDAENTSKTEMMGDKMPTGTIADVQCAFGCDGTADDALASNRSSPQRGGWLATHFPNVSPFDCGNGPLTSAMMHVMHANDPQYRR